MRLVITFFIPAIEKGAKRMDVSRCLSKVRLGNLPINHTQPDYEPRNPLAFVHEGLNLLTAQTMSKPARTSFPAAQHSAPASPGPTFRSQSGCAGYTEMTAAVTLAILLVVGGVLIFCSCSLFRSGNSAFFNSRSIPIASVWKQITKDSRNSFNFSGKIHAVS